MSVFKIKIMSVEGIFYEDDIQRITLNDSKGKYTIMKNHETNDIFLYPCRSIITTKDEKEKVLFFSYGIVSIGKYGDVFITCEACEWKEAIDINRAEESKMRAVKRMEQKEDFDIKRAERALLRAIARIETAS